MSFSFTHIPYLYISVFKTDPRKIIVVEKVLNWEEDEVYNCIGIPILEIICIEFTFIYTFSIHIKTTASIKAHPCEAQSVA